MQHLAATRQAATGKPGRRPFNGIEFVEFEPSVCGKSELRVYFLCGVPAGLTEGNAASQQFELYSPILRTRMPVTDCQPVGHCTNSVMLATASPLCDGAEYILTIRRPQDIDPQFARYRFTAHCQVVEISIRNESRQGSTVLLKMPGSIIWLATTPAFARCCWIAWLRRFPGWKERHVPDIGITLVELFAYVGDNLAYYQDAVATEAYLNTRRQRISVKRHARLVDYQLHEGCNARTFMHLNVVGSDPVILNPDDAYFVTQHPDPR